MNPVEKSHVFFLADREGTVSTAPTRHVAHFDFILP
jgi:hypothetical protein